MSQLSIPMQIKCSRCKKPVIIAHLETTEPDPSLIKLHSLMGALEKNALCPDCEARRKYYGDQGRMDDWMAGNV